MPEDQIRLRQEVERLKAEQQTLEAELAWLRQFVGETAREEAEAILAELLAEEESRGANQAGPETGTGERRRRLLAIRDTVREGNRRLLELQKAKDEVLGVVAHDLRTPLVAIQGFTQLLRVSSRRDPLTPKQTEYLERILQATQSMNRMVEDLLTARRLEQGSLPLRPRPVDLGTFAHELLALHREAARQKGVEITLRLPDPAPEARFDPDRVGQALGNLIQNAVKFTAQGGSVEVTLRTAPGALRLEVADQGPGIDAELLPRLFDRFTQGRIADTAGRGYGLGLYICREIASLHGGRVDAENREEGGSLFWIELPNAGSAPGRSP